MRNIQGLAIAIVFQALGYASPITVLNASFETATLPDNPGNGPYSNLNPNSTPTGGTLANWVLQGVLGSNNFGGAFAPTLGGINWTSKWWQGSNIGYVQGNISLVQTLADTLQDNATYTLQVDVGHRNFGLTGYAVELLAGGNLVGVTSFPPINNNSFATVTLTVNTGAADPFAGQPLEIALSTGTGGEAFFDNVRLDGPSAAAPEPASLFLAAVGLAVLASRRRARAERKPAP